MTLAVGVDLGGTKIAAGVVDENGNIIGRNRIPTPTDSSDAVIGAIAEVVRSVVGDHPVSGVCVAVPGFVDAARSTLLFTPNLPITNQPLKQQLEAMLGLPVALENDANAAAWGEVRFGNAGGRKNVTMLTIGTGLGGGLVVEGNLVRGGFGMAAEVGHMTLVPDGLPCGCGLHGCWEQYSSGNALVRIAQEKAAIATADAKSLLGLGDGTVAGIQGAHITEAAVAGDPVALAAFAELGDALGRGMASVSALLDPELFVLGGGVCEAGDLVLAPTVRSFEEHLTARRHRPLPEIAIATLGNDAGLIGAADLAR